MALFEAESGVLVRAHGKVDVDGDKRGRVIGAVRLTGRSHEHGLMTKFLLIWWAQRADRGVGLGDGEVGGGGGERMREEAKSYLEFRQLPPGSYSTFPGVRGRLEEWLKNLKYYLSALGQRLGHVLLQIRELKVAQDQQRFLMFYI
jgi:hypothetical protein